MSERLEASHSNGTKHLTRGREAFRLRAWAQAYENFRAADRHSPLEPEDLYSLAVAARLYGREDQVEGLLQRAHRGFLDAADTPRAVRCAFWLAMTLMEKGAFAPGGGWLARAQALLEESRLDCVEQGYLLIPAALKALAEGDAAAAYATFQQVDKVAERFGDHDLLALSRLGRGQALIQLGEIVEASVLFDEAMAAVTAGEVSSLVAGIVFCGIIDACGQVFDLPRARQWTAALSDWCDSQPDLVLYRGQCLVYRAEILQLLGAWEEAVEQARHACERLSSPLKVPEAGAAFYRLGELHRVMGRIPDAEEAYRRASKLGREPQPGLALLRLGQGKRDIAVAGIRRVVAEAQEPSAKCKALLAGIEIMLATGDTAEARAAAEELTKAAADFRANFLHGLVAHARGAVLLAEGDPKASLGFLRRALKIWQELQTPYEMARDRVLVGLACRHLGDEDTADMELDAARWAFSELGAAPDVARVEALARRASAKVAGGLTMREVQVLRLVAAGETNRAIAGSLFISEKTVDRHLSNIFAKLGVSSRAAATAAAYEKQLF